MLLRGHAFEQHQIIRHEKTFDDKVKGRIASRAPPVTPSARFTLTRHHSWRSRDLLEVRPFISLRRFFAA